MLEDSRPASASRPDRCGLGLGLGGCGLGLGLGLGAPGLGNSVEAGPRPGKTTSDFFNNLLPFFAKK